LFFGAVILDKINQAVSFLELHFISILKVKTTGFSRLALASRLKKLLDKRGTQCGWTLVPCIPR